MPDQTLRVDVGRANPGDRSSPVETGEVEVLNSTSGDDTPLPSHADLIRTDYKTEVAVLRVDRKAIDELKDDLRDVRGRLRALESARTR